MKKLVLIGLLSLSAFSLSGCDSINRAVKGDKYVDQKLAEEESEKAAKAYQKEVSEALKADKSAFPQLTDTIGQDQALIVLKTNKGDIEITLFPKKAPLAVENFLTHAKEGYYDNLTFHRVIADFMIQAGDPNGDGSGGQSIWNGKDSKKDSGNGFANEISPYLYNIRGAVSMANAGADTNGSQFFINQNSDDQSKSAQNKKYPNPIIEAYKNGGNPDLDGKFTVFGQVKKGMDVVDQIANTTIDDNDKPKEDIIIKTIDIKQDYSFKN